MNHTDHTGKARLRKRLVVEQSRRPCETQGEVDLCSCAVLNYSSEDPAHPIDCLIDGSCGQGGTYWASGRENVTEQIVLAFDRPQIISRIIYEVEESHRERTQEVHVDVSSDGGSTQRRVVVQEYNFSPTGSTFQHEDLRVEFPAVTHLSLTIVPNKRGSGTATLTCLRLFA